MIASIDFIILADFYRTFLLLYWAIAIFVDAAKIRMMTFTLKNGNLGNLMETSQHFWLGSEN
jgi:hypothetical protein